MSRALINNQQRPQHFNQNVNIQKETPKIDVFELVKRKFGFVLFFMVLGVLLSLLYFFKMPRTYESTAKVFVDEKSAPTASADDYDSNYESPVEKYLEIIKSTRILKSAIVKGDFTSMETFKNVDDILLHLKEESCLDVIPADNRNASGVIKLAFRGRTREECKEVLTKIVSSFRTYIDDTTKNVGGETTQLVQRMEDQMSGRLKVVNQEIQKLMARPELLNIDGRIVNPYHLQQTKIQENLHEIMRERTKLSARVESIRKAQTLGVGGDSLTMDVLQDLNENSLGGYVATHNSYVELKMQEQQMMNQFGPEHPELKSIQRQLATVDQLRMQELSALRGGAIGANGEQRDMVAVFLDLMDRKVAMLETEEKKLNESLVEQQTKSQALSVDLEKLMALQREREQLESGYSAIVERLSEIKAYETHLWRYMDELDPPELGEQVAPSLPISLAGGLLLGCLAGFLFAGFKELAEKTFRSSEDITSILGARVVGHVHQFQRRTRKNSKYEKVVPEVIALHQPASVTSEAYRAIRTSVFFKAQETGAKVIHVTSPTPGDGKSTTISNMAASIAQSGRRVLLIDADLRKPVLHKMFGLGNDVGLSSVITGQASLEDAIQVVQPEYLSVLACGPIPGNPAELLTAGRFGDLILHLREKFDYILIDSPPILAVTDPSIICTHSDLLYMVLRIRNGVRTNSIQAKEIIDSMGVELGGIVVNGLRRSDQSRYRYYGNGQGYGRYNYGNAATASPVGLPVETASSFSSESTAS